MPGLWQVFPGGREQLLTRLKRIQQLNTEVLVVGDVAGPRTQNKRLHTFSGDQSSHVHEAGEWQGWYQTADACNQIC